MILKALATVAIISGGILYAPQVLTGTNNSCHALEQEFFASSEFDEMGGLAQGMAYVMSSANPGGMVRRDMQSRHPGVPVAVSCAGYWYGFQALSAS